MNTVNVYYNPKACGLSVFASIEQPDLSYEYNILLVLKHDKSGKLFWAQDRGCSCPVPFEDYWFEDENHTNLDILNKSTLGGFRLTLTCFEGPVDKKQALEIKVSKHLKAKKRQLVKGSRSKL